MLAKFGILNGIGAVAALAALHIVEPQTAGGQSLLVVLVLILVNGIGAMTWPRKL